MSRSVHLFLADGSRGGVVRAEVGNWIGKVLSAPRPRLVELFSRKECAGTGIYVLWGPDPERAGRALGYIGEADDVAARLRYHLGSGDKDFFERAAVIVSSDDSLTKAHARYLEAQLIRATIDAGSVRLTNSRAPDFQRLPESDLADMDNFVDQLRIVLPILGFDLFQVSAPTRPRAEEGRGQLVFAMSASGAMARAIESDAGFVVLAGSTARRGSTGTFPEGYRVMREGLVSDGRLTGAEAAGFYRFAADVVFSSPSAAAAIVAGRSASGPFEWKLETNGTPYRDWKSAQLA